MDFSGRHVIVTGGTGALGIAVVGALLEAGAFCHVPHRGANEAERFPHRQHKSLKFYPDVQLIDENDVGRFFDAIPKLWASVHLAGGYSGSPVAKTSKSDLMRQIDNNLVTCFLCCRAAVNAMSKSSEGRIVNVAARPALEWRSGAGMAAYTASKAGVAALTAALAQEVADDNILVNAVAPSTLDTPSNRKAMPKADHASWPKVEEVAATILFLASPDNRATRGAVVPVYGKA
jgi:NAD(P)-dependent dehydrogenase (short-subunit alcohol dehydrogenase family)